MPDSNNSPPTPPSGSPSNDDKNPPSNPSSQNPPITTPPVSSPPSKPPSPPAPSESTPTPPPKPPAPPAFKNPQEKTTQPHVSNSPAPSPPTPPPPPTSKAEPQKSNKLSAFLIMFLILIILISGASFYAYQSGLLSQLDLDSLTNGLISLDQPSPSNDTDQTPDQDNQISPTTFISPTLTPPTPTSFPPVNSPSNWQSYQHSQCPISITIPPGWTAQSDCLVGTESVNDCIQSDNYAGTPLTNNIQVDQGLLITVSCAETELSDITELTNSCQQRIALTADEIYSCQSLDLQPIDFIQLTDGHYQAILNQQLLNIKVYPPPPTTFNLIKQVIANIRPQSSP